MVVDVVPCAGAKLKPNNELNRFEMGVGTTPDDSCWVETVPGV